MRNIADLKEKVVASHRKVYSIDDLGDDFDGHSVITGELSRWLNSKGDLPSITAYAPRETVKDMYEASLDGPLDLILEDDVIEADAISFVRGIDLEQGGGGEPAGDGTLRVTCGRYELGDPPGADR